MSSESFGLQQLGKQVSNRVRQKFDDRPIPSEKVSENFLHQVVQTIFSDLESKGQIPFVPEFQILNKTSLEDRFSGNIPDFSKHLNLIGLDKETGPDEVGVMNVAIDGEDAQKIEDKKGDPVTDGADSSTKSNQEPEFTPRSQDQPPPSQDSEYNPKPDWAKHAQVIEGGKS